MTVTLQKEALVLGKYFLGAKPSDNVVALYKRAIDASPQTLAASEQKLLQMGLSHPWLLGLIDSGLAMTNRRSAVRRRLYVMFAILESTPAYAHLFLPRKRGPLYIFVIGFIGIRAIIKSAIGSVLVSVVR